jgi:hypothetical protein
MSFVSCPHCGQVIEGDPQLAGRVVACPSCPHQFTMPAESSPILAPPVVSLSAPPRGAPRRQPPPDYTPRLVAWGITLAIVLVAGVGLIIALAMNSANRDSHAPEAAIGKGSAGNRPTSPAGATAGGSELPSDSGRLPELGQLIGRTFSANHPDAEARIAEAKRRNISVLQSGDKVRIGDVKVSNNPISDFGGFVFGIGQHPDGTVTLTTSGGDEPLRTTNSPASDRRAVEQFLQRHHGAANVKIEQLTDEPYYLARLANLQQKELRGIEHGRSSQEIQRKLDLTSQRSDASPVSIRKLERIGSVVRVVYRLAGTTRSDEEFLVLNGKVVYRFRSGRSAILFED